MKKTFKYRLYPTSTQESLLQQTLSACYNLYNEAKELKDFVYKSSKKNLSYFNQNDYFKEDPQYKILYAQVLQDTLRRIDKTYKAFFRRCQTGLTPGYPRFRSYHRYDSFTYPQSGFKLNKRLYLTRIGHIKIKLHRPIEGKIKTLTIKRQAGKWYACFSCEVQVILLPKTNSQIGLDLGLTSFIATSNGNKVDNPKHYKKSEEKLKIKQQSLSRKVKGSNNRFKTRLQVAKLHNHIHNQREDFLHKLSRKLINENDIIVIEDLDIQDMIKNNHLAKSINTTSWNSFANKLLYKAEEAGREVIKINPKGTSSTCYQCGRYKKKELWERIHKCECGLGMDRDIHAAKNILRSGLDLVPNKTEALIV